MAKQQTLAVLIVEDDPDDATLLRHLLRNTLDAFALRHVDRLEAALAELATGAYAAVLLDLGLPDSQGLATLAAVRAAGPGAAVVVLTALAHERLAASAVGAGAEDYVVKGRVSSELLRRVLRYAVERHRAEVELRESEARYRRLFEGNPHPMWVFDPENLRFLEVNTAAVRLYGYTRDEFLGMTIEDIRPPEDVPRLREAVRLGAATPGNPWRHRRKDGSILWVEISTSTVEHGGRGARMVVATHVTARRRDEAYRRGQFQLTRVLAEAETKAAAAPQMAAVLASSLGFDFAAVWILDPGQAVLRCRGLWPDGTGPFERLAAATRARVLSRGEGLPGAAWASGVPEWSSDLARDPRFLRASAGPGLSSGCFFPVVAGAEVLGVIELLSQEQRLPDDDLLALMADVGSQVAQFIRRKRAEEDLAAAQRRLQHVVSSSPAVLFALRPRGDHYQATWVSENLQRLTGYTAQEGLEPRFWLDGLHPEDAPRVLAEQGRLREQDELTQEYRFRHRHGGYRWIRAETRVVRGVGGEPLEVIGSWSDVTQETEMEQALRVSEARYRELFLDDLTGKYVSTPEGRLLDCNPAFLRMFAFPSLAAAQAARLDDLYPAAPGQPALAELVARRRRVEYREVEARRRDGTPLHVVETVIGTFDEEGRLQAMKGFVFDDTQRHSLESQLRHSQKMEAVGRLAGGIAHDFNNLLGVITGYADLLLRDASSEPRTARRLGAVREAAERAAGLTRQLLAFSRRQVLQPRLLDVNAVIVDLERMLRRLIGEDVDLVTLLAPDLAAVRADPGQVEQVLMNLVVNARDAMPEGGRLIIETSSARLDAGYTGTHGLVAPGEYVQIAVSDTGEGIPPALLGRIFEPFFTTKPEGKGTGLGLATVYGIAQQSGGFVNVYSEPGQGATFKVYLPTVKGQQAREEAVGAERAVPGGTETILLVEDAESLREVIGEMLEEGGYQVLAAGDPEEAFRALAAAARPVHLLLTDVVMPGLSGPAVAQRVRQESPRTRVLFMSGYTNESMGRSGVLEPGTHFIQKPFAGADLLRKVREVLDADGR